MQKKIDLTTSNIKKSLFAIALPIMATSFVQMCYNLTDIMWLGRVGAAAVAASGTAGFFMWLSNSLILIGKCGTEIGVSRAIGENDKKKALRFAGNALGISSLIGFVYILILIIFNRTLIGFFDLGDAKVINDSVSYLYYVLFGMGATFISGIIASMFIATGDSKTPFKISAIGLGLNIVLDPLFIFILKWDVAGAAVATSLAQIVVLVLFVVKLKQDELFSTVKPIIPFSRNETKEIFKWGIPVALESALFCLIAMVIAKIVAIYGYDYVAIQKVGSQIESISWMSVQGFGSALTAFMSQNYGAKNRERIVEGYRHARMLCFLWGIFTTAFLYFFAGPVFSLFLPGEATLQGGIDYLKILAVSQMPMCIELINEGAFRGIGKTIPASVTSIVFNLFRIPMALFLIQTPLGVCGIWWSITISSIIKGIILNGWFGIDIKKLSFEQPQAEAVQIGN